MKRILFDNILSVREGMGAVAVAKPWLSQSISKPATWNWSGLAIEPSLGGATGSRAVAEHRVPFSLSSPLPPLSLILDSSLRIIFAS